MPFHAGYNNLISCSERASPLSSRSFHPTSIRHSLVLGPRNGRQRARLITLRTTHSCDSSAFQQAERSNLTIFDINRLMCLRNAQSDTFVAYAMTAKPKSLTTQGLACGSTSVLPYQTRQHTDNLLRCGVQCESVPSMSHGWAVEHR